MAHSSSASDKFLAVGLSINSAAGNQPHRPILFHGTGSKRIVLPPWSIWSELESMFLGIDISGDALRHCVQINGKNLEGTIFGIAGIPPRVPRERFLWNRPRAVRFSKPVPVISLADAWRVFIDTDNAVFSWVYESGINGQKSMPSLVSEALSQNLPESKGANIVVSISNYFPENRQETLLEALADSGITNAKLLWRPIALALSFLEKFRNEFRAGQQILVIDAECYPPEATILELTEHQHCALVPLRRAPKRDHRLSVDFDIYKIRREIASDVSDGDADVARQLYAGPFASDFIAATEMKACGDIWCQKNGRYFKVNIDECALGSRAAARIKNEFLPKLVQAVKAIYDFSSMSAILWHGWPFRQAISAKAESKHYILDGGAVSRGAALYASKLSEGIPTYQDTLPGVYIMSEVRELGTYCFFHLIKPSVIEGGHTWKRDKPITRFSVRKGIREFTAVLRKSDEEHCRKVVATLPRTPNEDAPVLIRAEAKPASGYALVTIEGAEGHKDIFGDFQRVKLNWNSMEKIDTPIVYAPDVYPVRGRIFDEDDPEYKQVLIELLRNENSGPYQQVTYRGHSLVFNKLLEPWGLTPPWHLGYGRLAGWSAEPARGMFGSLRLPLDEFLIEQLWQRIQKIMHQDRIKFLNYMFIYAPESFKKELREKFSQDHPSFVERNLGGGRRPSWNWIIAPGRVFSTREDFELFVDFMINHSEAGYPSYPNDTFTKHYWWSFFRCLCYHVDTVNVPPEKILSVLKMIHAFVTGGNADNNTLKYCLCAILFSLRIRHLHPDFLQPNDNFCSDLAHAIKKIIPRVPYPPTMLSTAKDPHGEGLNGLVLRFLMQTASKDDYHAIEGLTTSMA